MLQITDTGIATERLDVIHARLVEKFKAIYGQDIVVTPDSPDGQMIGIFSQALADINEVIAAIIQMLDPYQATGVYLDQRSLYAGVIRKGGEYSYVPEVVITDSNAGLTVPEGTVLIDSNRVRWQTVSDLVLDENGSGRVDIRSEERGPLRLPEKQSLQFELMLSADMKAETIKPSKVGRVEESDPDLLTRFMLSHAVNNEDDRAGIQASLMNIPEVEKCLVLENPENTTDPVTGLPPHSVNAILVGGEKDDIALVLVQKKKGGAAFYGAEEHTIHYKGMDRRARWDYASPVEVSVTLRYERLVAKADLATGLISQRLKAKDFHPNESVFAYRLIAGINDDLNFNLVSIFVNGSDRVNIGFREYAVITEVEVEIG